MLPAFSFSSVNKDMVLELLASLHDRDRNIEGLQHRIHLLLHRLYGPRGERFDPNQLLLFVEMVAGQDTAQEASAEPPAPSEPQRRCRPHGRRRLPENLPREPRHHELSEAELRQGPHRHRHRPERATRLPAGIAVCRRAFRSQIRLPLLQPAASASPGTAGPPGPGVRAPAAAGTRAPAIADASRGARTTVGER